MILNIYNPLHNLKVTKEKKSEKNYPVLDFLKVKSYTKRKKNHFTIHNLNINNNLKYL